MFALHKEQNYFILLKIGDRHFAWKDGMGVKSLPVITLFIFFLISFKIV